MRLDPLKFVFDVAWWVLLPYALAVHAQVAVVDKYQKIKYNRKIKSIVKNNPDIAELRKLSGQDKKKK